MSDIPRQSTFKRNAHIAYFRRCLQALPAQATSHDSNRITIAYFCLSGLDLLGALEAKCTETDRSQWAEWIWSLQARALPESVTLAFANDSADGGFRGSTFMTTGVNDQSRRFPKGADRQNAWTSPAHLPSTYTALLCLALLRAPLDRLDFAGLQTFLRSCQSTGGSFSPLPPDHIEADWQSDLRMTYCASVVADVAGIEVDVSAARHMIDSCKTWEGGYAARPGIIEAQGGTTYCAVASLTLLSGAGHTVKHAPTVRWLLQRQIGGFQGRPGKAEDVCYSFWCGGALSILGHSELVNSSEDVLFLLSAQSPMGGFGKEPEDYPDPYHSYLALAALAMHDERNSTLGLQRLDPRWNISVETAEWLKLEITRVKRR